jgi:hypothetical protein
MSAGINTSFCCRFSHFSCLTGTLLGQGFSDFSPHAASHRRAICSDSCDSPLGRFGFVAPTCEVVALAAFALALSATRYLKKHGDFRKHGHAELLF